MSSEHLQHGPHDALVALDGETGATSGERQPEFDTLHSISATLPRGLRPLLPLTDFTAPTS